MRWVYRVGVRAVRFFGEFDLVVHVLQRMQGESAM
jgi:hypothetical protein